MEIKKKTEKKCLIFFALFQLSSATVFMQFMKKYNANANNYYDFILSLCFYILVFIIPIIIYLILYEKVSVINYLKLRSNILSGILIGILISIFIILIFLIKNKFMITNGLNLKRDAYVFIGRILVGPLEEIPFRGFYLQKLKSFYSFWKANFISSALFASMHITEILNGQKNIILSLVIIFVIGLWMGYIFEKTKSLWTVSIVHSVYNLCIFII